MTKVHPTNDRYLSTHEKLTFKNTKTENNPLWSMGYIHTDPTIKSFENENKKQLNDKNTTHSNSDVIESLKLEKAQHE
jgi:hypothetical protein